MDETLNQAADGQHDHHRRVLIVTDAGLLADGIKWTLLKETNVELHVVAPEDTTRLIQEINRQRPSVIILNLEAQNISPLELLGMLDDHSQIRLLGVSLEDEMVQIYDYKTFVPNQLSDFVTAVVSR